MVRWFIVLAVLLTLQSPVWAEIDLSRIAQIESSGNPLAFNSRSKARGLYQITPICLKEYNSFHKAKYGPQDLFNPKVNEQIASWYLNVRIPKMLRYFGRADTTENRIICYSAGISYVVSGKPIPSETKQYLKKYGV